MNAFRFNDLTVLIDGGKFERGFSEIDHRELEFQKENDINTEFSFLDLCMKSKIKVLHKCL